MLIEVTKMKSDDWVPIPIYCSNCGMLNYGYRNSEGKIRYECASCGTVFIRVQKSRRHDTIDVYAPVGCVRLEA